MFEIQSQVNKKSYSPRIRTGYYRFKGGFESNRWQHVHTNIILPQMIDGKIKEQKLEIAGQVFNYDKKNSPPESYISIRMDIDEFYSLLISELLAAREYAKYFYARPEAMRNELQKRLDGVYSGYFDERIKVFGFKKSDGTYEYRKPEGEED